MIVLNCHFPRGLPWIVFEVHVRESEGYIPRVQYTFFRNGKRVEEVDSTSEGVNKFIKNYVRGSKFIQVFIEDKVNEWTQNAHNDII